MAARRRERKWRPRRDWGRLFALMLSLAFAVVGAVPLGLGLLVRTTPVRAWAARQTSAWIARELGVAARYDVSVRAWPMMVALENVVVEASDGGPPFMEVERIAARPRPFSLLGGQLDVGDVEIVGPRIRLVIVKGELQNLRYRLPDTGAQPNGLPVASLAITDARIDAILDGVKLGTRELDVDVSAEEDRSFELALRAGETAVTRVRPFPGREATEDAVDDDVICRLEARVRVRGRSVLIRRLLLAGSVDFDPDPGTRPSCKLPETDWRAVELRLGAVRIEAPEGGPLSASGRVHAKLPAALAHRFADLAHLTGSITLDVEGDYDGVAPLPRIEGHVSADRAGIDGKIFGKPLEFDLGIRGGTVHLSRLVSFFGDGKVSIPEVTIEPLVKGIPLNAAGPITLEGLELPGLLRDLGAHPQAHVAWTLDKGHFDYFRGHLSPPVLEGPLSLQTHGFEIYSRPTTDPQKAHLMGVREGSVRCNFVVNGQPRSPGYKFPGIVLSNASIDTPRSHMGVTVTLGFNNVMDIEVHEGTLVDLTELTPLGDIPIAGMLALKAGGRGAFDHPKLTGELKVTDFVFAGMPIGEVDSTHVAFEPMILDLGDARLRHNQSRARSNRVRLDFSPGATVVADADVDSTEAPGLRVRDLFEVFRLDKDPRLVDIDALARGKAQVRYVLGGKEDRCGGGSLALSAHMNAEEIGILGERFDGGTLDADVLWDDQAAGTAGMRVDVHSATLRKGEGSVLLGATVRPGGFVKGNAVASGIPIARLDAFGAYGKLFDGTASTVAELRGTLAALEVSADVDVSRLRIGPATLGPSHLRVAMEALPQAPAKGRTACGNPRGAPFDQAEFDKDLSDGDLRIDGALFDGQVALDGLRISRQKHKVLRGVVAAKGLDLGTLANLVPGVAYGGAPPRGALSATLDVKSLPFDAPQRGVLGLVLDALDLERDGARLRLLGKTSRIELAGDELKVPNLKLEGRLASGLTLTVVAGGSVRHAVTAPDLDLGIRLEPTNLARLSADIPAVDRAGGTLELSLRILGPIDAIRSSGELRLRNGELALKGMPVTMADANVDVDIGGGEARIRKATARVGGGSVEMTGRMPLRGPEARAFSANITAVGVKLPVAEGIDLTTDAALEVSYRPGSASSDHSLRDVPDVKGTVTLTSFKYTRPIALNLSLGQLGRAPRTNVDTYDPANDVVRFNVNVISTKKLRFANDLVDMDLEVVQPGLVLSGTNQRVGARGQLRILSDSKVQIRSNEFLVREGFVSFDDPLKITPKVDVRAQTEYRRFAASTGAEQPAAAAAPVEGGGGPAGSGSSVSAGASTNAAGIWRITLQARGDADNLKVTLSSDPALSQEDIVFLLTIGMTRAEIDRAAASALGESVGLEALSALTGADKAVKTIVPIIDEFRFGTGYSTRTARTEPTVTVGKRITDSVRASVTTGVSEDREVRSNIEWRLNRQVSVQGSYDNLNDVSSSPLGNLGVDLRWRIEFE